MSPKEFTTHNTLVKQRTSLGDSHFRPCAIFNLGLENLHSDTELNTKFA